MKVVGWCPRRRIAISPPSNCVPSKLAGLTLDQARITNGHYESNGSGGFNLIIDSVTARDGRTINVHDEELRFSIVAKK